MNFVFFVAFVRTRLWHQCSLPGREISHEVHKGYQVHKFTGDGTS